MDLPTEMFTGGRTRYIHLRIVKFDIDYTVTSCSCKYHHIVGITCRHIIAVVGDVLCSMIDVRRRKTLQHYFGAKGFDDMTQVL
jgi:hypothetical protein